MMLNPNGITYPGINDKPLMDDEKADLEEGKVNVLKLRKWYSKLEF
jgi:hypothetical protein